jgi:hypothetical protein
VTTRLTKICAFSTFGSARASQRKPASPFVTIEATPVMEARRRDLAPGLNRSKVLVHE